MTEKREIYLDHSASTPVDPRVVEAMLPYFTESYGNASGLHRQARASARALDGARRDVAEVLDCKPKEVVFTSCGSESDNLAIRGAAWTGPCGRSGPRTDRASALHQDRQRPGPFSPSVPLPVLSSQPPPGFSGAAPSASCPNGQAAPASVPRWSSPPGSPVRLRHSRRVRRGSRRG